MTHLLASARSLSEIQGFGNLRLGDSEAFPDTAFSNDSVGKVIFGFSSVGFDLAGWVFEAGGLS